MIASVGPFDEWAVCHVVEAFMAHGQQVAAPIQGIVLGAPMAERLVLYPPAALINLGVGVLYDVEGIRDLGHTAEAVVEDLLR